MYLDSGSWSSSTSAVMIEVKGFVAPVPTPGVTISESALAVTEGGATDTYTVVLDTAPTGDVTIAVTETSPDISLSATTLTFGTANWSNAQTVTVTAVDDSITESEETVTITHSVSATADTTDYPTTLTVDSVSVTVTDNDATPPGAPVLTAAAKNESIELTWTIANHGSSDITRFEYRIKETTGGTYPVTWTDSGAAASNTGGSATIGSLTNGTQYTVQVRGVNSVGEGADSNEASATPRRDAGNHVGRDHLGPGHRQDLHHRRGDQVHGHLRQEHHAERRLHLRTVHIYQRRDHREGGGVHGGNGANDGACVHLHRRRRR